jgi:hypothetical protein
VDNLSLIFVLYSQFCKATAFMIVLHLIMHIPRVTEGSSSVGLRSYKRIDVFFYILDLTEFLIIWPTCLVLIFSSG